MWEIRFGGALGPLNKHIMKRSKNYAASEKKLSGKELYSVEEAVKLLKETSTTKFDATAEVHFNLNIDPTKADQAIRGTVSLPHGTGKKVSIAAVVEDSLVKEAKEAGADEAGLEDLIEEFSKGKINYDVIVAMPTVMKHLGKVAKTLGQKGVMPSPKAGTVTPDVIKTIKELKAGRIEYRNDKQGNIHSVFGKVSFSEDQLVNNLKAYIKLLKDIKPAAVKGTLMKSVHLATTMGPGIKLDIGTIMKEI